MVVSLSCLASSVFGGGNGGGVGLSGCILSMIYSRDIPFWLKNP